MTLAEVVKGLQEDREPKDVPGVLVQDLTEALRVPRAVKRLGSYHASELRKMCPAEAAYIRYFAEKGAVWKRLGDAKMRLTFDIGDAVHDVVRQHYFPLLKNFVSDPAYDELGLRLKLHPEVTVGGAVDSFLRDEKTGEIFGVEIKSIKTETFKSLTMAQIDHRFQVYHYLWLLQHPDTVASFVSMAHAKEAVWGHSDIMGVKRFIVFYVAKQHPGLEQEPFKPFLVDPVNNEKHRKEFESAIAVTASKLSSINRWRTGALDHPSMLCSGATGSTAMRCFFNPVCFGGRNVTDFVRHWEKVVKDLPDPKGVESCPFLDWT